MKVLFQGTGAADGIPPLFASSRVADYARSHQGKDVRSRSTILIDDSIKIDFGPDSGFQMRRDNVRFDSLLALLFTHSDDDHIAVNELQYALHSFTDHLFANFPIFANEVVCEIIQSRYPEWPFEVHAVKPFEPFSVCDYLITPIAANHKLSEDSLNFIVEKSAKKLIYATDTGFWLENTWNFCEDLNADGLIVECTEGENRSEYYGHLDVKECIQMVQKMRETHVIRPDAQVWTTHHAHYGNLTHDELSRELSPFGIQPAYDSQIVHI